MDEAEIKEACCIWLKARGLPYEADQVALDYSNSKGVALYGGREIEPFPAKES